MTIVTCPQCHKDDMVQKVSAIVNSGTAAVQYSVPASVQVQGQTIYGSVQKEGVSSTLLAHKLTLPSSDDIRRQLDRRYPLPKVRGTPFHEVIIGVGLLIGLFVLGFLFNVLFG